MVQPEGGTGTPVKERAIPKKEQTESAYVPPSPSPVASRPKSFASTPAESDDFVVGEGVAVTTVDDTGNEHVTIFDPEEAEEETSTQPEPKLTPPSGNSLFVWFSYFYLS